MAHIYRTNLNLYTPDSVLLASLTHQLKHTLCDHTFTVLAKDYHILLHFYHTLIGSSVFPQHIKCAVEIIASSILAPI